jgi:hypothetical protein
MNEQYVVLGVARVRSTWFRDLSRWSTSAALPVDFVKCISLDEVRTRLASGRAFSALLVDAALVGLDRDLTDAAHVAGCAVVAVDDGSTRRDWTTLGVDAVLAEPTHRDAVLATLHEHGRAVSDVTEAIDAVDIETRTAEPTARQGRLVAVVGGAGTGRSTLAMAIAQGMAHDPRHDGSVALADLALRGDLALLHDCGDVVPGVQELAEAHRTRATSPEDVRSFTFLMHDRGYHLLLGLRRPRDWAALRPRSVEAAIDGLLRAFRVTVADVDAEVDGEAECGSLDVEERNALARSTLAKAHVATVIGSATLPGLHRQTRVVVELVRFGVTADRLLIVVNRAPRSPSLRSDVANAIATSISALQGRPVALPSPLFVAERARIEQAHRDAVPLPTAFVDPVHAAVNAMLERVDEPRAARPTAVVPGSLGAWAPEAGYDLSDP